MTEALHKFGSIHTKQKLDILEKYLPAYTTALKKVPFTTHYIDAFAGTGVCYIKVNGERLMVPGSVSIALKCDPQFHKMLFIESRLRHARALERLIAAEPGRNIAVVRGDANELLCNHLLSLTPSDRAIVFLDPYGMQVEWSTLEAIARSRITDLWYLFPLSGLYRQATKFASDIDADKAAALTRILGTDTWRTEFYQPPRQPNLFFEKPDERTADIPQMLDWVKKRLETIFPGVADPKILYQTMPNGRQGAPIFALFFAISNPSENAKNLALRIARGVLKLG